MGFVGWSRTRSGPCTRLCTGKKTARGGVQTPPPSPSPTELARIHAHVTSTGDHAPTANSRHARRLARRGLDWQHRGSCGQPNRRRGLDRRKGGHSARRRWGGNGGWKMGGWGEETREFARCTLWVASVLTLTGLRHDGAPPTGSAPSPFQLPLPTAAGLFRTPPLAAKRDSHPSPLTNPCITPPPRPPRSPLPLFRGGPPTPPPAHPCAPPTSPPACLHGRRNLSYRNCGMLRRVSSVLVPASEARRR